MLRKVQDWFEMMQSCNMVEALRAGAACQGCHSCRSSHEHESCRHRLPHADEREQESMERTEPEYPRPPVALILTSQEWVSLAVETLFAPRGYATLHVGYTGAQALQRLRDTPVDVAIIARDLRDMPGAEVCRMLRAQRLVSQATPVVLLASAAWRREDSVAALRSGAWATCSLPLDGEEFFLGVDNWVRAKLAGDEARLQGLLDAETGFYNVQGLLQRLAEAGAGAVRHGHSLGCVMVSLYGAAAAEETDGAVPGVAPVLAATLRSAGRASDVYARLSGTEFAIIAPHTDGAGICALTDRLRRAIASASALAPALRSVRCGSCAVANFRDASLSAGELLMRAGDAMREAAVGNQRIAVPGGDGRESASL
jgi:diguanylate cyclase (GGDEF)-like protein